MVLDESVVAHAENFYLKLERKPSKDFHLGATGDKPYSYLEKRLEAIGRFMQLLLCFRAEMVVPRPGQC